MKNTKVYVVLGLTICVTSLILLIGGFMLWEDVLDFDIPVVDTDVEIPVIHLPDTTKEVVKVEEGMVLPFTVNAKKTMLFFDKELSDEQLNQAVIAYDGVYRPNLGNVYTYDGKAFEAVAVKSGVIENVYVDPLLGNTVILNCDNVLISYQGLASTAVKKGVAVKQGDVLGVAGNSEYYKECGVHVFVSAKMNNQYVDVESLLK